MDRLTMEFHVLVLEDQSPSRHSCLHCVLWVSFSVYCCWAVISVGQGDPLTSRHKVFSDAVELTELLLDLLMKKEEVL